MAIILFMMMDFKTLCSQLLPLLLILVFSLAGCHTKTTNNEILDNPFSAANPWPEIRKERIHNLLHEAMKAAEVDAWLTISRENNNDPISHHIGGENAGRTAVFLFILIK